jgi:hypothetical protein
VFLCSANLARFKAAIASGEFGEEMLNSSGEFPEGTIQNFPGMSDNGNYYHNISS